MNTRADRSDSAKFLDEEPISTVNPSSVPPPPLPPILHGWSELGLLDPRRDGRLRTDGSTADVLAFAGMPAGTEDPAEGILDQVGAIAAGQAAFYDWVARSIASAKILRRRIDDRAPKVPSAEEREADEPVPPEVQARAAARVAAQRERAVRRAADEAGTLDEPPLTVLDTDRTADR